MSATHTTTTAQAATLARLTAAEPEFTFSSAPVEDDLLAVSAVRPADGLLMEWVIYSDGTEAHLSTRYPYGSEGWEPHPDDWR